LPFISLTVTPDDVEKEVARELMVRLPDRRVLSSKECCDTCIDISLTSIQEIRGILVDKQVELAHLYDGSLYLLVEYMLEGIRQFLTFTETRDSVIVLESRSDMRPPDVRERYFGALEVLRFHIHSCLTQVAKIAEINTPKVEAYLHSNEEWHRVAYIRPQNVGQLDHRA
jgi:hypothetical protein